jgi:hypothetical protein
MQKIVLVETIFPANNTLHLPELKTFFQTTKPMKTWIDLFTVVYAQFYAAV